MLKPVTCSIDVPQDPERVYDVIDLLPNHETFTDHFMVDWSLSGPTRGVGAKAKVRLKKPGPADWLEVEVVDAEAPVRNVEEGSSAGGKRKTRGTYTLAPRPGGGTHVTFTLEWMAAPAIERVLGPITRSVSRRSNAIALKRLAERLATEG
jgi:hypothetical protein